MSSIAVTAAVALASGALAGPSQQPRLVVLEPCANSVDASSVTNWLEPWAAERGWAVEVASSGWERWSELGRAGFAAVYLHTVGTAKAVAVACFDDPRARDRAWYRALAQAGAARWSRGTYVRGDARVWWMGLPPAAVEGELSRWAGQPRAGGALYVHADGLPTGPGSTGPGFGWPALAHRLAARDFLTAIAGPSALSPSPSPFPSPAPARAAALERPVLPRISAPDSAALRADSALRVVVHDPWGEPVRVEAILPHGLDLRPAGAPGTFEVTCCDDLPAKRVYAWAAEVEMALIATAGAGDAARTALHRIRVRPGPDLALHPLTCVAWGGAAGFTLLGLLVEALTARRARARRARGAPAAATPQIGTSA